MERVEERCYSALVVEISKRVCCGLPDVYASAMAGTGATAVGCRLWAPAAGWWALAAWIAVVITLFATIDYHWRKKTNIPTPTPR